MPSPADAGRNDNVAIEHMTVMPKARLGHIALKAQDPSALAAFYGELFAMELVGGTPNGAMAFLASYADEESHDIVFSRDPALAHIAFKVDTLADLLATYRGVCARNIPVQTYTHGVSLAAYFRDPEDNLIELYWPTNRTDFSMPFIQRMDFDQTEEALLRFIQEQPSRQRGPIE